MNTYSWQNKLSKAMREHGCAVHDRNLQQHPTSIRLSGERHRAQPTNTLQSGMIELWNGEQGLQRAGGGYSAGRRLLSINGLETANRLTPSEFTERIATLNIVPMANIETIKFVPP